MSSYVIGEPVEEGWWVLVGNYDLTDSDSDYYISDDLLNELLSVTDTPRWSFAASPCIPTSPTTTQAPIKRMLQDALER